LNNFFLDKGKKGCIKIRINNVLSEDDQFLRAEGKAELIQYLKHALNPLHVYCRLCDLGIARERALMVCRIYERFIFRLFANPWRVRD
jgi:hypothetical protein